MNEKDREYERLSNRVIQDDVYNEWRKFFHENRHRLPPGNGSAIRDMSIVLMKEFLGE